MQHSHTNTPSRIHMDLKGYFVWCSVIGEETAAAIITHSSKAHEYLYEPHTNSKQAKNELYLLFKFQTV